jgi:glyoxylate/hydroxypyruvate reductase A
VVLTPHVAGDISPAAFVDQLFEQVDRFERGEPLENEVDRARGY